MTAFLKRISVLGYKVGRKNLRMEDASEYGVSQRRHRMILLASKIGQVEDAESLRFLRFATVPMPFGLRQLVKQVTRCMTMFQTELHM
ncbi:hypothetical protein A8B74_10540 [Sulfitobacter geojensis]|nr:hypothetical protein A8B74_10540 [Sulfitobacter geojensis]